MKSRKFWVWIILIVLSTPPLWSAKVKILKVRKGYRLYVNGRPFVVKGVCYNPVPIGEGPNYNFFAHPDYQPWKVDAPLMKKMGVNVIRFYQVPVENLEEVKKVVRYFYDNFKIYTIIGDWLGFWNCCYEYSYADESFRKDVEERVLKIVSSLKDEPGIIAWILGNENNYSFRGRVQPWSSPEIEKIKDPLKKIEKKAQIYYEFVNNLAKKIKEIDKLHPVGLGNGELIGLEIASQYCPDIDFLALIVYRGKTFGNIFKSVKFTFDKPILFSEFGADAYDAYKNKEDEDMQTLFLKSQWMEIFKNVYPYGERNCLGGVIFEWCDEWWKHNPYSPAQWSIHDTGAGWSNGSYYFDIRAPGNLNMNEEWFGIVGLENIKENNVDKRLPRRSYYMLKQFWKNPYKYIRNEIRKNKKKRRRRY